MPKRHRYYMLIASLPLLPQRLESASRLPINRQRLMSRLRLLEASDWEQYEEIGHFRETVRHMANCTDADVAKQYEQLFGRVTNEVLRAYIAYRRDLRIITAALRRRIRRQPPPLELTDLSRQIAREWAKPDFGLGGRYRWTHDAHEMLSSGDVLGVEELMSRLSWNWLQKRADQYHFSFEAVMIYVLRWNLLEARLDWDVAEGQRRFDSLVSEALGTKYDIHHAS